MVKRLSQSIQKTDIHLSKKWTVAGIVLAISAFLLNPDACISSKDLVHWISPDTLSDAASHIGMVVGSILAIVGKGLLEKK